MTDAIITHQGLMPALTINEAVSRYNALVEFTRAVMKEGKDFGVIPGTGNKPTLLKPGAEKLCSLFGLAPEFEIVESIVDFESGLFYYLYKCRLSRDGNLVGEGEGSANSKEVKYRYRNIPEWKATEEEKAVALRVETRTSKKGNQYKAYVVENSEPFDLINTLQKMAQKRALVAATLIAANASEFFTQDIEDMVVIEGEFVPEPTETTEGGTESNGNNKGNGKSWPEDFVKVLVKAKIAQHPKHAVNILNLLQPETVVEAEKWGKLYRGWRDKDDEITEEEAAAKARKGEVPK